MSGRGSARKRKAVTPVSEPMSPDEGTGEDYHLKRQRNNVAVCKTRQKKRQEEQETNDKVNKLKEENEILERLGFIHLYFLSMLNYDLQKGGSYEK